MRFVSRWHIRGEQILVLLIRREVHFAQTETGRAPGGEPGRAGRAGSAARVDQATFEPRYIFPKL